MRREGHITRMRAERPSASKGAPIIRMTTERRYRKSALKFIERCPISWLRTIQCSSKDRAAMKETPHFTHAVTVYWISGPSIRNLFSIRLATTDLRLLKENRILRRTGNSSNSEHQIDYLSLAVSIEWSFRQRYHTSSNRRTDCEPAVVTRCRYSTHLSPCESQSPRRA